MMGRVRLPLRQGSEGARQFFIAAGDWQRKLFIDVGN
jgi:hypothetical protein